MVGEDKEPIEALLAGLGPELEHVLVSATIDALGKLGFVGGLAEKVETALTADALQSIHAVGLASDQRDSEKRPLSKTTFAGRIVDAPGYDTLCRQPIVLAPDLSGLVHALDRTLNEEARFGKRLSLPPELMLDDPRYGEAHYFGRGWLRKALADFIGSNPCGYAVIAADAIWGKTSFALDWYRHSLRRDAYELPRLSGWVFIRKESGGYWVDPVATILGLEAEARYQCNLPHFRKGVPDTARLRNADPELAGHMGDFLNELGKEAVRSGLSVVLLIDGVDEIWGPSGEQPSTLLPGALPKVLPQGVFIVLLSRPGYHLRWKGGSPTSPCLSIDLAAALGEEKSALASGANWRQHIQEDLEKYIEWRAGEIERTGTTQSALDTAQLLRTTLRAPLLAAAQGYLFVLAALLESGEELSERLRSWQAEPESMPKGPKKLIASVITRILSALDQAKNQGKLGNLHDTDYVAQTLACLGLATCLRQPLEVQALVELLFNPDEGAMPAGAIPRARRIGLLNWKLFNEEALKTALRFGAECFVGRSHGQLPRTTAFWHPLMRDALRAAWTCVAHEEMNPDADAIVAKLDAPAAESLAPLHLLLAAASSRYWLDAEDALVAGASREARAYALAWGPWHAAMSGDARAIEEATRALADPIYLQAVYNNLGTQAHHSLDVALEALLERSPPDASRLFNIRRTLVQHDAALSSWKGSVATTLFNDLGGLEPPGSSWPEGLARAAAGTLVRRQPGTPVDFLRFLQRDGRGTPAISTCGHWLAVPDGDAVLLFRVEGAGFRIREVARIEGHDGDVNRVAFSAPLPGGRLWLASASDDRTVGLLALGANSPEKERLQRIEGHTAAVRHVAFSASLPDGRLWLASASEDQTVGLLALGANGPEKEPLQRIEGHTAAVRHVAFSASLPDGRLWLASASRQFLGLLALSPNGPEKKHLQRIQGHTGAVNHVAFSAPLPDGRLWLASASGDQTVGLLALGANGPEKERLQRIEGHTSDVYHVAFSAPLPDGRLWLASASEDRTVGLLALGANGPEKERLQRIEGHTSEVNHVAFSASLPDGRLWLASTSDDGTVGLLALGANGRWDERLQRIEGHTSEVFSVAFSAPLPDGRLWLASAGTREIILWSIPEGKPVARISFAGTGERIHDLRWSDDGRLLFVAGQKNRAPIDLTLLVPEFDRCPPHVRPVNLQRRS